MLEIHHYDVRGEAVAMMCNLYAMLNPNSWPSNSDGKAILVGAWIAAIVSLLTIGLGIFQYLRQQKAQQKDLIRQQNEANKRPFRQKQLELYFLASQTVSSLATEFDSQRWEQARNTFWQLYWGQLGAVESREVEEVMVQIGRVVPDRPTDIAEIPLKALQRLSLDLAHAIRDQLPEDWNILLPPEKRKSASST
jgi:hypothetical protein